MASHQGWLTSPSELTTFLETHSIQDIPEADLPDGRSTSLLLHAASVGNFQVLEILLAHDVDLKQVTAEGANLVDYLSFRTETKAEFLESVLQKWSSKFGDDDLQSMLNSPRLMQRTPLMSAVFAPNVPLVELLLRSGARASYALADGSCALDLAAQTGGLRGQRLVKLLLEAQADPNVGSIGPLFLAAQENDETSVQALLTARARPEGLTSGGPGTTPVECAARFGFLQVLKLLLAADGAPRGKDLTTALKLAAEQGHVDVERILMKAGAADDRQLEQKRAPGDDAQLLMPSGFQPGTGARPSFMEPKPEAEEGRILVEEVDGCYKLQFQGGNSMTASTMSPVRLCAAHNHFYFEVSVQELDLLMAVGFSRSADTPRESLPGWTPGTYGLHSDDGLLQANGSATRVMAGWKVKAGSTVGIGVQWNEEQDAYHLFVTLDGQRQPREVPLAEDATDSFDLWPLVGADRPAVLLVNLGTSRAPFVYRDERNDRALAKRKTDEGKKKLKTDA